MEVNGPQQGGFQFDVKTQGGYVVVVGEVMQPF